jgi:CRP/FNR family cyclic AMP-dependent transcriptional regulator
MAHDVSLSARHHTATSRRPVGMSGKPTRGTPFDFKTFLSQAGDGSTTLQCQKHQTLFVQGDAGNAVFYILEGLVKLSVVSQQGKEAVVALFTGGDFFGENCLAGQGICLATATSLEVSTILRIDRATMKRALHYNPAFSELVMSHLVARNERIQEDLIDQLVNSAEKRLARTLLLLAHPGQEGSPESVIPKISQTTLAEMVGTTRSRVSFFMNRFKQRGFIEYDAGLRVHSSLLNVVLSS